MAQIAVARPLEPRQDSGGGLQDAAGSGKRGVRVVAIGQNAADLAGERGLREAYFSRGQLVRGSLRPEIRLALNDFSCGCMFARRLSIRGHMR
jgi:hypothetical protein